MPTLTKEFTGAGVATVTDPAPSGARWVITHMNTTAGVATVRILPSSGLITAVSEGSSINGGTHITPSGDTGYAEALEIESDSAAIVTIGYGLLAPNGRVNEHHVTNTSRLYFNDGFANSKWFKNPITGEIVRKI